VTYGGSEGRVRELVAMGVLRPSPTGGFEWANQKPSQEHARPFDQGATDQPAGGAEQQQNQQQEPSERLDQDTEATIGVAVEKLGVQQVAALAEHTMKGNDVAKLIPEVASRLGMESEQAQAVYDRTVAAFVKQAQAAASTAGVSADAWDDFCEWARTERPAEKHKAESEHFEYGRTGGIKALAKEYAATGRQFDAESVLAAEFGNGITARKDESGAVILSIPGHGSVSFKQAVALGLIRVSKR
jgi:hypothetical protein